MIDRYISYYTSQSVIVIAFLVMAIMLGVWLTEYPTKTFLFIVLGIIGIVISIFKPMMPLFLFFLFIPMESITLMPSQTLNKLIGLFLGFLFFTQIAITKKIFLPKGSKSIWILVFGTVAVVSLFVSQNFSESQTRLITLGMIMVMYFLICSMIRNTKTLNIAILFLIIGGFISVMLNLMMGLGFARHISIGAVRRAGLMGDPNNFAAILLVLLPLSLLQFFRSKSFFMKAFTLTVFSCLLIGFFKTFSRGGFVAFSVMTMLSISKFNLLKSGSNKIKVFAYMIIIVMVGTVIFLSVSESYITRLGTLKNVTSGADMDASIEDRFQTIKDAINVFWDNPIIGVGIRSFKSVSSLDKVAHNTYLEVLAGMGLLGFIPFIAILFLSWRELKRIQNFWKLRGKENSFIYQTAVALELGFIAYFVVATFLSLDLKEMTWLLITFSSVLWNISLNVKEEVSSYEERNTYPLRYPKVSRS